MLPLHKHDLAKDEPRVILYGVDISNCSSSVQFLILCATVFVTYCGYGYMQELIFRTDGMKPFGWYLTLIQFCLYSLFATAEVRLTTDNVRRFVLMFRILHLILRIPLRTYIQLAFYTVATMGLSNSSVGYLNYPTQVIFKCCKLIPVLIGGKRFGIYDIAAACMMSLGLVFFTLADNAVSPNFDPRGYVMISLALVADAIIGNVQEKAIKAHHALNCEVVLYSYSIGSIYILMATLISYEFFDGMAFFASNPQQYIYAVIFSVLGYAGINVVLTLVRLYGALIAVTVTTMRKAVTIVLSFIFFAKPFTWNYLWSASLVLIAIYLNVYSKNQAYMDKKIHLILLRLGLRRQTKSITDVV